MIIDFHTHIYPEPSASKTLAAVQSRAGVSCFSDGTRQGLALSMDKAGIDLSVVCSVATKPEMVESIHQWLESIRTPRILPFATMHPGRPAVREEMQDLKKRGFKGFKVHPDYQGFFVDEKRIYPFYEAAQSAGMIVLFHAGLDRGLPDPIHSTPERLAKVHKDFPSLCMVVAHMGGEAVFHETERYLLGRDVFMDTSFVLRVMPRGLLERFVKRHPAERILFGSDSPWTDQAEELRFLMDLPYLKIEEKEKIAGRNAAELLGLSQPPDSRPR
ncbi:MAG: amidohydrolase family protein [Desulfobacterota bacterium]|nr:amidohydrolase family protein [Thermodesulfobacteriota bacterium]